MPAHAHLQQRLMTGELLPLMPALSLRLRR